MNLWGEKVFSPSYSSAILAPLMRIFYHEWILSFAETFSAAIKMIVLFLSFLVLLWCITLIDLHLLNQLCDPG